MFTEAFVYQSLIVGQCCIGGIQTASRHRRFDHVKKEITHAMRWTHLASACSVNFQYASTGTQENIEVNKRIMPQTLTIANAI